MDLPQGELRPTNVIVTVAVLIVAKYLVHTFQVEFLTLGALFSSVVAGAIFIVGSLLTSTLPDYKEAERLPAEIRVALEAIHGGVEVFRTPARPSLIPRA